MPLDEYRRKRDFAKTPEPRGDERPPRRRARTHAGFFCVQKHISSHLHYDLRLEHDGVLLSWAVPKGPSIDARDRRLAMQTEDHPLGYGTFEGVIPAGYGAGIVMLWDQGTWVPEVDDVDEALRRGDLKFTLDGFKLRGSWALVRTSERGAAGRAGGSRSWLLLKHRDDWSGPLDITTFAPRSVKSEGEFEDILAADSPEIWHTERPAKTGATGAMLAEIIRKATTIRAAGTSAASTASRGKTTRKRVAHKKR